jgi:hypothetical protein
MDTGNWITIASVIVVVSGWFINGWLNRKHEMFKKRTDFRLEMFNSYTSYAFALEKLLNPKNTSNQGELVKELIEKLEVAQVKILLYGTQKEVELVNEITNYAQSNSHLEMKNTTASLMRLISENIRSQLGLPKIRISEQGVGGQPATPPRVGD